LPVISGKAFWAAVPWLEPKADSVGAARPTLGINRSPALGSLIFRQESIKALLRTLSARDPYTGYHSNRVTNLALAFARSLGLPSQDVEALTNAGYLHDIGKIGISDAILLKPGPLTPEERRAIETHPLIGHEIVEPLGLNHQEKNLILLHHERWDGKGYPHGLKGNDIPFLSRLLALADVFDALTSDRPYRRAFTIPQALAEIELQAGQQFDPDLAQRFTPLVGSLGSRTLRQCSPPPWLAAER